MTTTLHILHRTRSVSFTVVLLTLIAVIWLLCTDLMFRYPIGGSMLWHLKGRFGFWPAVDHSIRGLMGVYMVSKGAHWTAVAAGIFLFFATQFLFLRPCQGWVRQMTILHRPHPFTIASGSLIAAWLTVGAAAIVLELLGYWSMLQGRGTLVAGYVLYPSFWVAAPLFLASWAFWACRLARKRTPPHDGFRQFVCMLYAFFVAGGLILFIAGLLEANHGFVGQYWQRGTFTAAEIGFTTILWTLAPGTAMIYTIRPYTQLKDNSTLNPPPTPRIC